MSRISLAFIVIVGGIIAASIHPFLTIALVGFFVAIVFLARNLGFGLLLLVFFFPYLGLVVDFGSFEALREVPYLREVNAPFIDIYGLVFFAAWVLSFVISTVAKRSGEISHGTHRQSVRSLDSGLRPSLGMTVSRLFPHWRSYLAFWLSGLVSLFKVSSIQFAVSIKYFARPFTFAYLVFFAVPVNILSNVKGQMSKVLKVFYCTGLLSAFNGLLGLLFGPHLDFPRATPWGAFGVSPLGFNHNLLAETLIATAPAGLILSQMSKVKGQMWYRYGMFFQWGIALLTFARTAWIAVAVQAVVYLWFSRRQKTEDRRQIRLPSPVFRFLRANWLYVMVFVVFLAFLATTTFTETVRGSTFSRLDQARIATFYFEQSPLIGQGIGTFLPSLWQVRAFLLEYGEPVEAHGVLFKLAFEQGLFGLIAFTIFIGAILIRIKKSGNVPALLIAAGSVAYQLFNTTYYTSKLWVPLAIALAVSRITEQMSANNELIRSD